MKRMRKNRNVFYLPVEIIRNILKRLPVKSLIRFQCVCKLWKNLIQNPSFITDHLQHSSRQNPSLLLEYDVFSYNFRPSLLDCELQVREVQEAQLIDSLFAVTVVGSCNGLICLQDYMYGTFVVWNPATTAVRRVPRACWFGSVGECVAGFGFSPIVNDYKIVMTYAKLKGEPVGRVGVFSLGRGTWREIDIGNLKGVKLLHETVTANGSIFWSGVMLGAKEEAYEDYVPVIVSFDIAKGVFTTIYIDDDKYQRLTVYDNKLALLCKPDLLVFDEGMCASGKTLGWTKINSSPLSYEFKSVGVWGNEIIFQSLSDDDDDKGRRVLCLTNVATNEVKKFTIPCGRSINNIYNYVESLVPVGNN